MNRVSPLFLNRLAGTRGDPGGAGLPVSEMLLNTSASPLCRLAAAFLLSLCGPSHPEYAFARRFLSQGVKIKRTAGLARLFLRAIPVVKKEMQASLRRDAAFRKAMRRVLLRKTDGPKSLWPVFFPEGLFASRKKEIEKIRRLRRLRVTRPNPCPVTDPAREILFTSNLLLTLPPVLSPAL